MSKKTYTVASHGRPPADTKIIIVSGGGCSGGRNLKPGDVAYVTPNSISDGELVVNHVPGQAHGCFVSEWTEYETTALDSLTDEQRQALTDAALEAAEKRGYCGETLNILTDLGLPTKATVKYKTVTVEVEVKVPGHRVFSTDNISYSDVLYSSNDENKIVVTNVKKVDND